MDKNKIDENNNFFIENIMKEWLNSNKNYMKPTTFQKYNGIISNHIVKKIGDISINNITTENINDFISYLMQNGNNINQSELSVKTINDILIVLNMGFSFAKEKYHINPPKIKFLKNKHNEVRILTSQEQEQLEKYLMQDIDIYKFAILLTLYSGMRIGELCALNWSDINNGNLKINKTMLRVKDDDKTRIIISEPKTISSNRIIPLSKSLIPIVEKFRKPTGYVISNKKGKFIEPRLMQIKFKKIIAEAGIPDINFHALRHTFATRCVEANFEIKSLSEILGHSNVKITLNLYVHSSFELKQENMNKLQLAVPI